MDKMLEMETAGSEYQNEHICSLKLVGCQTIRSHTLVSSLFTTKQLSRHNQT